MRKYLNSILGMIIPFLLIIGASAMMSLIVVVGLLGPIQKATPAPDSTTLEHFLSGSEITLPEINGVVGIALHPQIKLWAAKHFPPEKREEAYRAMLEEIFSKKIKLEMPASIAPYFTPLPNPHNDNKSDDASPPK
jgi:hypothetical protein